MTIYPEGKISILNHSECYERIKGYQAGGE